MNLYQSYESYEAFIDLMKSLPILLKENKIQSIFYVFMKISQTINTRLSNICVLSSKQDN